MIQGIGLLLEEAGGNLSVMTDGLEKFERLWMLDGLRDVFSGTASIKELLFAFSSLEVTFKVDPKKVQIVRSDYIHSFLLEQIRASPYRTPVDLKAFELAGIAQELATPILTRLFAEGFLVQGSDGTYTSSPKIWEEDVQRFREKVIKLDSELGRIIADKSRDYEKIGRDYEKVLDKVPVIIDSLMMFNEGRAVRIMKDKLFSETKHFQKHHAGSWTQEMVRQFRQLFRKSMKELSSDLRVEVWQD